METFRVVAAWLAAFWLAGCGQESKTTAPEIGEEVISSEPSAKILANIPSLAWPTDPKARISLKHGAEWRWAKGCDGQWKRHVGIDIAVGKGRPVYAAEFGEVIVVGYDDQWKQWVTISHTDWQSRPYTTTYNHIVTSLKKGDRVIRGRKIAEVADMGTNTHLHFSIRNAPYSNVANRGALPEKISCGPSDPQFPEYTLDPLGFTSP